MIKNYRPPRIPEHPDCYEPEWTCEVCGEVYSGPVPDEPGGGDGGPCLCSECIGLEAKLKKLRLRKKILDNGGGDRV